MKELSINATLETPKIFYDLSKRVLEIKGRSLPENALEFYEPLFSWVDQFINAPAPELTVNFKLEYFNTASSRQIIEIIVLLAELKNDIKLDINWFYRNFDEDMLHLGKEYADLIQVKFNFVEF